MYVLGCLFVVTIPYIEVGLSDHPVYIRSPFAETIPFVRSVISYRWGKLFSTKLPIAYISFMPPHNAASNKQTFSCRMTASVIPDALL